MTTTSNILFITAAQRETLAEEFAQAPVAHQRPLMESWTAQYGEDVAYDLAWRGTALIIWPQNPVVFRAQWSAAHIRSATIRETTLALTDEQISRVSSSLRAMFVLNGDPDEVWALAAQMAGVA